MSIIRSPYKAGFCSAGFCGNRVYFVLFLQHFIWNLYKVMVRFFVPEQCLSFENTGHVFQTVRLMCNVYMRASFINTAIFGIVNKIPVSVIYFSMIRVTSQYIMFLFEWMILLCYCIVLKFKAWFIQNRGSCTGTLLVGYLV